MSDSTLAAVRLKVRRLTRSPSTAQLSNATLDEYVNTFIQYDFPEHLRLFSLRRTITFYTTPNIDTYSTIAAGSGSPLFNFKNKVISVHEPVYVAGYKSFFSQSRDQFFNIYPFINSIQSINQSGDGATTLFTGTLPNAPLLRSNVTFTSIGTNNAQVALRDAPFDNTFGNLVDPLLPVPGALAANNQINYITGAFRATFTNPPAVGEDIEAETVPFTAGQSNAVLFFNNEFTLRPVPDKSYPVNVEVYLRPTELLAAGTSPELEQWWQYIAYGASKKIFEDRTDLDSVQQIMPEFKQQERLVLRKTIVQQTNERTATIYTNAIDGYGGGFFGGGSY